MAVATSLYMELKEQGWDAGEVARQLDELSRGIRLRIREREPEQLVLLWTGEELEFLALMIRRLTEKVL